MVIFYFITGILFLIATPSLSQEQCPKGMVYIPPGRFIMGAADSDPNAYSNQKPQHEVEVGAFCIDKHEVTNAEYNTYDSLEQEYLNNPNKPVVFVNWYKAKAYCEAKNKRLPTEAEWEKAAIGPTRGYEAKVQYATKSGELREDEAIYKTDKAADVCSKPGNGYGLCDMTGNVWEWVNDWYSLNYYSHSPVKDPKGPSSETSSKVLRGGSWGEFDTHLRISFRSDWPPDDRRNEVGFRCVVSFKK